MRKEKYKKKNMKKKSKRKKIPKKGSFSELQTCRTRVRPVPFSNSEPKLRISIQPGSFSELWTCQTRVGHIPLSELQTCQTRVQPCLFSELRTCWTRVRLIPFSKLQTCRARVPPVSFSELQTRTPNQGSAQSFLRTPNRNSELWVKTQSWTKLAKPGRPACNYSVSGRPQHSRVIVWTILQTGRK